MEMIDEFLLQEGYIGDQLLQQLTSEEKVIESSIDTSLGLLVDGRVPKERIHHQNAARCAEIEIFAGQNYSVGRNYSTNSRGFGDIQG